MALSKQDNCLVFNGFQYKKRGTSVPYVSGRSPFRSPQKQRSNVGSSPQLAAGTTRIPLETQQAPHRRLRNRLQICMAFAPSQHILRSGERTARQRDRFSVSLSGLFHARSKRRHQRALRSRWFCSSRCALSGPNSRRSSKSPGFCPVFAVSPARIVP